MTFYKAVNTINVIICRQFSR